MTTGWDGSGNFTRGDGTREGTNTWAQSKAADQFVDASPHDTHDQILATGIQACLAKNGENAMTGTLDLGGYKISNFGNTASVDGRLCEKIDSDVFTPHLQDDDDLQLGGGEYTLQEGYSQTIGDIVYFTVKLVFTTITTTLNTDGIYVDISNTGAVNGIPFDGDTPTTFHWPCHVEGTGGLNMAVTGHVEAYSSTTLRVNLQKLTGDPAVKSNIGTAPSSGDSLFISGWYKIDDDSILIPST